MSDAITVKINGTERAIGTWINTGSEEVNIVVTGRNNSGKTALVSALCDERAASEKPTHRKMLYNIRNPISAATGNIVLWDTCGMCEGYEPWKSDVAVKALKSLECLKPELVSKTVLLYCVRSDQSRFLEDINSNLDFKCMMRLTAEFGEAIWNNSVVVFTFVNESFEENEDSLTGGDEESRKKSYYTEILAPREARVRKFVGDVLLSENKARSKSIPVVPAGFRSNSQAPTSLNCDSAGESWLLNLWQKIIGVSPVNCQPLLLNYWFERLYKSSFFYTDSFLSLMKLHGSLYLKKAELAEGDEKIAWVFSFLRIIKIWFSNIDKFRLQQQKSSTERKPTIQFWRSLQAQVDIIVTGAKESGKTSLINSLLYEKCQIKEVKNNSGTWSSRPDSNITCNFTEKPLEHIPNLNRTALLLVCVRLEESEEDLKRYLEPVASKNPQNFMIVLTFSKVNLSGMSWKELVDSKTEAIKRVLKDTYNMGDQVIQNLKVVPASYYTEKSIPEDPEGKPWIMNVWLNSIASTSLATQSAMAVFVNYSHYGRKKISADHKSFFLRNMYNITAAMLETHSTSYNVL